MRQTILGALAFLAVLSCIYADGCFEVCTDGYELDVFTCSCVPVKQDVVIVKRRGFDRFDDGRKFVGRKFVGRRFDGKRRFRRRFGDGRRKVVVVDKFDDGRIFDGGRRFKDGVKFFDGRRRFFDGRGKFFDGGDKIFVGRRKFRRDFRVKGLRRFDDFKKW